MADVKNTDSSPVRYMAPDLAAPAADEFSAHEKEILGKVNAKIAGAESLEEMIDFLFNTTRPVCPCDRTGIAFLEEDGRIVSHYVKADYEPIVLGKGYAEDVEGSSLQAVIEQGTPRIITDLVEYLKEHPESRSTRLIVEEGVRSSMTAPLFVGNRPVGLLFRSSRRPDSFGLHHVYLYQQMAERLGQAVEKAYQIAQLEAANNAYFEMLGFVSHELKSPVASLVTDASLLAQGYLGDVEPRQKAKLERMISKGEYLLGLVREYLELARIEGGELKPRFTVVGDFVKEVLDSAADIVSAQLDDKGMRLIRKIPRPRVVAICDPDLIRIVLVNLLGNAIKYGDESGELRVTIRQDEESIHVSVWNQGPGFPEEQRSRLFRKFFRLTTPQLQSRRGTGVGLYTAWRIVRAHGGKITAHSKEGSWAEFSIVLPQP